MTFELIAVDALRDDRQHLLSGEGEHVGERVKTYFRVGALAVNEETDEALFANSFFFVYNYQI